jgi:hypothetical protein
MTYDSNTSTKRKRVCPNYSAEPVPPPTSFGTETPRSTRLRRSDARQMFAGGVQLFGAGVPTPPKCPTEGLPEALTTTAKGHPRAFAAGPGTHSLALPGCITRSHAPRGNAGPDAPRRLSYDPSRIVREHHS